MNYLKNFVIPFRGLKTEVHHFDFVVDNKFFDGIEYAEFEQGLVNISLDLIKQERMMIFEFELKGFVEVPCDRCLEPFNQNIEGRERLIVKFGEKYEEQSDEVILIPESDYEFDISPYIYEYINLLLPMQRIHPDDENGNSLCDEDMLNRLTPEYEEPETDPRWEALKKLKK
ncbi:MAG: DUF177 domain-containing protein [Bacteroidales bacterium]|nr:DUF177 domain-containing protein [Bacteroidales bacterium]